MIIITTTIIVIVMPFIYIDHVINEKKDEKHKNVNKQNALQ